MTYFLHPEDYGAVGDGTTDDSSAFNDLILDAQTLGLPIALKGGTTYGVGATSWSGFDFTLSRDLLIEGNGATIKVLVEPAQQVDAIRWGVSCLFRFDGSGERIELRNLGIDLNGLQVVCLHCDQLRLSAIGNFFANGENNTTPGLDAGIHLFRCSDVLIMRNRFDACGTGIYTGHTDEDYHSSNLRIVANRFTGLSGDFIVGVMKRAAVLGNAGDGCYSGVAAAASATDGTFSEDVVAVGNVFSAYTGHGFQTDIAGTIKNRNLTIAGNVFRDPAGEGSSYGVYALKVEGLTVKGNRIFNGGGGILVLDCDAFAVADNNIDMNGVISGTGYGIALQAGLSDGVVSGNVIKAATYGLPLLAPDADRVEITDNIVREATQNGVYCDSGSYADVRLRSNVVTGSGSGVDINNTASAPSPGALFFEDNIAGTRTNANDGYTVNGVRVLGVQQAAIANLTVANVGTTNGSGGSGDAARASGVDSRFNDVEAKVNAILSAWRAHGGIAT
jgi:hypothetical protein